MGRLGRGEGGSRDSEDTVCGALGKFFREGNSTKVKREETEASAGDPGSSAGEGLGRGREVDAVEPGQGWSSSSGSRSGGLARRGRGSRQGEEAALAQPRGRSPQRYETFSFQCPNG